MGITALESVCFIVSNLAQNICLSDRPRSFICTIYNLFKQKTAGNSRSPLQKAKDLSFFFWSLFYKERKDDHCSGSQVYRKRESQIKSASPNLGCTSHPGHCDFSGHSKTPIWSWVVLQQVPLVWNFFQTSPILWPWYTMPEQQLLL